MGLTQHPHAVPTIAEITNVLLMRGMIGKPGAGVCPVRGHSNVQGDRTMGIWEKMPETFLAALDRQFGITSPRKHGLDTVDAIRAMRDGRASVFIGMGGNFASATPDTAVTEAALRTCALTVQVSTKLNRSHLVHGRTALILPTLGRTDRDVAAGRKQLVSVEDSMSMVHLSRGSLHAAGRRRCAARSRSSASWPARCSAPTTRCRGNGSPPTTTRSATRSPPWCPGCADYNREVRAARRLPAAAPAARLPRIPHQHRQGQLRGQPAGVGAGAAGAAGAADAAQPRPVQHHHLRSRRPLPRRRRAAAGWCSSTRPTSRRSASPRATGSTWCRSSPPTGEMQERRAKDFLVVPYSTPVGNAAAYYPETNPLVPLDHVAAKSNTPVSKAIVRSSWRAPADRVSGRMGRVTTRRAASHVTADDTATDRPETLVVEEPLEIRVNGTPVTVTMRTPGSDVELAQGFLLTEGVIARRDDILTVRYCRGVPIPSRRSGPPDEDGANTYNVLDVTLRPDVPCPTSTSPATSTPRRRAECAGRRPWTRSG